VARLKFNTTDELKNEKMTKGDRQVQRVIDTLGIEVVRELAGKPEATEGEVRQLVRQAITNWKRRSGIAVEIKPYDNGEERLESLLDWLNRPSSWEGGNDADNSQQSNNQRGV
jgi:hypothetical protein